MWRHEGGRKGVPVLHLWVVVLRGLRIKAEKFEMVLKAKVNRLPEVTKKERSGSDQGLQASK